MRVLKIVVVILFLFSESAIAGGPTFKTLIMASFRIGYAFGENGGATYGFGLSIFDIPHHSMFTYGGSVSIDFSATYTKIHLGIDGNYSLIANLNIGPTLAINKEKDLFLGFSSTLHLGLILYPYASFTNLKNTKDIFELGGNLWLPFAVQTNRGWNFILSPE